MLLQTRIFGEIDIDDEKKLVFEDGLIGLPDLREFFLIFDAEEEKKSEIIWLQSVDEPSYAMPLINPLAILPDYNPAVEDELLSSIAPLNPDDMAVFVTLRVPEDVEKMTVNLKAPLIINAATCKGCQLIVENEAYEVRFPVYNLLEQAKEKESE